VKYGRAIVVGSGIAGLTSARVLSDHFDHVTLLDSDEIPKSADVRSGAAQSRHLHTLLPGGLDILSDLFPNLENALDKQGGMTAGPSGWYALTSHGKTYRISRFQPTPNSDPDRPNKTRIQTRPLLELCIRQQVEALPNVDVIYQAKAGHIETQSNQVTGVSLQGIQKALKADLVVDASGRASKSLEWLKQMSGDLPEESAVNCDFAYCSALFRPKNISAFTDVGFLISSAREGDYTKRGGSLARVEDGLWQVTLAGRLGDYPPRDLNGFLDYIGTLPVSKMSELLENAELVSGPSQYLFPKSIVRHYERLTSFPEGLLPIGDTICQLNPGYGQGMSVSCRQAMELDSLLRTRRKTEAPLEGLWRDYLPCAFEQTRGPWVFAALMDFSKKGTTGDFPDSEAEGIRKLKILNKRADKGDTEAASLVDSIFDLRLPFSALDDVLV